MSIYTSSHCPPWALWQRDERFIRNLTDSVLDFEERCRRQAEALERAKLLNEQAEQLKKEADRLGNQ